MKRKFKVDKQSGKSIEVVKSLPPEIHSVQDDTIPPTVSHATDEGLVFTSLSKLKAHYAEHGYEISGGDHLTGRGALDFKRRFDDPREYARAVQWGMAEIDPDMWAETAEALRKVKWGMAPISEREQALCEREQRSWEAYKRAQRKGLPT